MSMYDDMTLIDGHVHLFGEERPGLIDSLLTSCGLTAMTIACIPSYRKLFLENLQALRLKRQYPGRLYVCGGLMHPMEGFEPDMDFAAQLRMFMAAGCDGVKMLEGKPSMYKQVGRTLVDPVYDEYYAALQAENIPVVLHVADPSEFWDAEKIAPDHRAFGWYYGEGGYPTMRRLREEVDEMLARFPNLRLTLAHFYFYYEDIQASAAFMDAHPTVCFDLTPCREMYREFSKTPDAWREFFIQYDDRLVFGTDNFLFSGDADNMKEMQTNVGRIRRFLETDDAFEGWGFPLKGLTLPRETLEKIYHRNFEERFGDSPREVNLPAAAELCRCTIERLSIDEANEQHKAQAEDILASLDG